MIVKRAIHVNKMGIHWMCSLAAICLGVVYAVNADTNDSALTDPKKITKNIGFLVGELDKETDVTFNGNEKVLSETLPLVTFGKVYEDYEELLELSKNIQNLEKEKKKITRPLDEAIEKYNAQIHNIMQTGGPSTRKLAFILSGKQGEVDRLLEDLKNEDTLINVRSKLQQVTQRHVNRWKLLRDLNQNVESLKKQDTYGNISDIDKVENYLLEYEKAKTLANCREFIAKALKAIKSDHYEMQKINTVFSPTGLNPLSLEELKKKLSGENNPEYGNYLLEQIRTIKHLHDFTTNELDKFGPEQASMNSMDALISIIREKKEERKSDIIASIMQRISQIRNGGDLAQPTSACDQVEHPNGALPNTEDSSTFNPLERQTPESAQDKLRTREPSQENQQPGNEKYLVTENQQQPLEGCARMQMMGMSDLGTAPSAPHMDQQQLYQYQQQEIYRYYQQQQAIDQAHARAQQQWAIQHTHQRWQQQPQIRGYSGTRTTPSTPYMDQQQWYHYYQQQQPYRWSYMPYRQGYPYNLQYYNQYAFPYVQQPQSRQSYGWPRYPR